MNTRIVLAEDLQPGDVIVKKVSQTTGGRFIETAIPQLTVGRVTAKGDDIAVFDLERTRTDFYRRTQHLRIHRESN